MNFQYTNIKVFNSPLEIALRLLLIISKNGEKGISLDRLVIYDYLIINSGDIDGAPNSIHPALPNRSSQLLVKRELIKKSLQILLSKELLTLKYLKEGILYSPTKLSIPFINYFESDYFVEINNRVEWILNHFDNTTNKQLDKYIKTNLNKWGSEFVNESYFREEMNYE
jgi:hypothetical protein